VQRGKQLSITGTSIADYKYLGSWITEDGRCEKEVSQELLWIMKHSGNTKN